MAEQLSLFYDQVTSSIDMKRQWILEVLFLIMACHLGVQTSNDMEDSLIPTLIYYMHT